MLRATDNDVCNACDGCVSERCEAEGGGGVSRGSRRPAGDSDS